MATLYGPPVSKTYTTSWDVTPTRLPKSKDWSVAMAARQHASGTFPLHADPFVAMKEAALARFRLKPAAVSKGNAGSASP